jgi:hypothetical protein
MSLLLDKIIPLFVYPVGFAVAAGLVCLVFLAWGWRKAAADLHCREYGLRVAGGNACGGSVAGAQPRSPLSAGCCREHRTCRHDRGSGRHDEPGQGRLRLSGPRHVGGPVGLRCTAVPGWQIRPDHCHRRAVVRRFRVCPVKLNWSSSSWCFWVCLMLRYIGDQGSQHPRERLVRP